MNKGITRLQLLDSDVKGYLDVLEGEKVPLNFSISDIRDISSRSGMFSKTIKLAGTKNNNNILNNYFDVNIVAGTFDVNKRQKVAPVQNGVVLRDNCYMRLTKVIKKQNVDTNIDEYVEYEVQITDELGDFFKEVGNKEIKQLTGWTPYKHIYNNSNIIKSFDHTVEDGYKYVLPYINDYEVGLSEMLPGIYAKQIFDKIHEQNGFTYEWDDIADDSIQFDKVLIPYAGDQKKLTEEYIEEHKVIVENITTQNGPKVNVNNGLWSTDSINFPIVDDEIQDRQSLYNDSNSTYGNTQLISSPNSLNYNIKIEYDMVLVNDNAFSVYLRGSNQRFEAFTRVFDINSNQKGRVKMAINSNPSNPDATNYVGDTKEIIVRGTVGTHNWASGEHIVGSNNYEFNMPISNLNGTEDLKLGIGARVVAASSGGWCKVGTYDYVTMKVKIVVKSIKVTINNSADSPLLPGSNISLQTFLPNKIKQSDFLKSIYQKYNLYVEVDEDNPSKLIYTSRDKFYDTGEVKDWTEKLHKKKNQELYFIPDITTKRMVLSYKDDSKDTVLESYLGETSKTFGQVGVTFSNENVKGEERKEEIFSPTISMQSEFGAILPILDPEFKMNIRYLQDGGKLPCGEYKIKESDSTISTLTDYPHISMFDRPFNPQFSVEYAMSNYYAYDFGANTQNNLYNLHWRRTLAQINSGKMLKAYFWLDELDIQGLRMNDKIKVNNALYYINAVIDYDANAYEPTKVELLTVEDELKLTKVGGGLVTGVIKEVEGIFTGGIFNPPKPTRPGGFFTTAISKMIDARRDATAVVTNPVSLRGNFGVGTVFPKDFKGIVLEDNMSPTENGIYISEDSKITSSGITTPSLNVDGDIDAKGISHAGSSINIDDNGNISIGGTTLDITNAGTLIGFPSGGGGTLTPITYANLTILKSANNLEPGTMYHITDRDIWIDAVSNNELTIGCKRRFKIVKDEYYTPHISSAFVTNNFLGIYGQTINKGSVPNSGVAQGSTRYLAVWGGRMWLRNNIGTDTPGTSNEIIAGGWTIQTSYTYYENKIFDIKYNFDDDIIWTQSDDRGNVIKRESASFGYIDITDWGNNDISGNENYGIYNNYGGISKALIYRNLNNGKIYNNNNVSINYNNNIGQINNNSNGGSIENNTSNGDILSNTNSGTITSNSNSGNINNNSNTGNISLNDRPSSISSESMSFDFTYNNSSVINLLANTGFVSFGQGNHTRWISLTGNYTQTPTWHPSKPYRRVLYIQNYIGFNGISIVKTKPPGGGEFTIIDEGGRKYYFNHTVHIPPGCEFLIQLIAEPDGIYNDQNMESVVRIANL